MIIQFDSTVSDYTDIIQLALNTNSIVELTAGVYSVRILHVPSYCTIVGRGDVTLKAISSLSGPQIFSFNNVTNCVVSNICFDGSYYEIGNFNNVVQLYRSRFVLFDLCRWVRCRGIALLISESSNCSVTQSSFTDCGTWNFETGNNADRRAAIAVTGVSSDIKIDRNLFLRIGLDAISFAFAGITNVAASGNTILDSSNGAIYASRCDGVRITDNYSSHNGGNAVDVSKCQNVVIANNTCQFAGAGGVMVADSKNVVVNGNICRNNYQGGISLHKGGVTLSSTLLGSVERVSINGNVCFDDQVHKTQRYAIGVRTANNGTYEGISIDRSNVLYGYDVNDNEDDTAKFQSVELLPFGFPQHVTLSSNAAVTLYVADRDRGVFEITCQDDGYNTRYFARAGGSPLRLCGKTNRYVTYSSANNTAVLKNVDLSTRTFLVSFDGQ